MITFRRTKGHPVLEGNSFGLVARAELLLDDPQVIGLPVTVYGPFGNLTFT